MKAIKQRQYMDDYLDSVDSRAGFKLVDRLAVAIRLIEDVSRIQAGGGFQIRGWTTNSVELR